MQNLSTKKQRQHGKNGLYFGVILAALGIIGGLYFNYEVGFYLSWDLAPIYLVLSGFIGVGIFQAVTSNKKLQQLNAREISRGKQLKFNPETSLENVVETICEEEYTLLQIENALKNAKFSLEEVQNILEDAQTRIEEIKEEEKEAGERNMIIGILLLTAGVIFSAIGSGKIFYGAVVMGIGLMIKGYRDSQLK